MIGACAALLLGCGARAPTPGAAPIAAADTSMCGATTRWLASSPRVPLAATVDGRLVNAGACSERWAAPGTTWRALDEWGAPLAEARTLDAELYDVTGAWEQRLEPAAGGRLMLAADAPLPTPTVPWTPDAARVDALVALVAPIEAAVHAPASARQRPPRVAERTHFFRTDVGTADEHAFAVVADATLTIAQWIDASSSDAATQPAGWAIVYLDTEASTSTPLQALEDPAYQTVAVVDLDGDGVPEVVVHRHYIDAYDDVVLRLVGGRPTARWEIAETSVGGAYA